MSNFIRVAAVSSMLGALTTALLIFLPAIAAPSFEDQAMLHSNPWYMGKLWVFFFHPQFNGIAMIALATLLYKKYPGLSLTGIFFMMVWSVTEAAQQAFMIDAVNQMWRPEYMAQHDTEKKQAYFSLLTGAGGIRDSMYFLILYCFGIGSLLFGMAMVKEKRLGLWIGVCMIFFGVLSLASFARYYAGAEFFSPIVDAAYQGIYPWLQPLARVAIGIWLWRSRSHVLLVS